MVDIYVGPEAKHYRLPKDMLCYYSTYFDRCFNGGFKEAKEQKLVLSEDSVEFFELLMDYIFINGDKPIEPKGDSKCQMQYCMDFVEYAGMYDLPGRRPGCRSHSQPTSRCHFCNSQQPGNLRITTH